MSESTEAAVLKKGLKLLNILAEAEGKPMTFKEIMSIMREPLSLRHFHRIKKTINDEFMDFMEIKYTRGNMIGTAGYFIEKSNLVNVKAFLNMSLVDSQDRKSEETLRMLSDNREYIEQSTYSKLVYIDDSLLKINNALSRKVPVEFLNFDPFTFERRHITNVTPVYINIRNNHAWLYYTDYNKPGVINKIDLMLSYDMKFDEDGQWDHFDYDLKKLFTSAGDLRTEMKPLYLEWTDRDKKMKFDTFLMFQDFQRHYSTGHNKRTGISYHDFKSLTPEQITFFTMMYNEIKK